MAKSETVKDLYRRGLGACGFGDAAVARGLEMLESGRYYGFADVTAALRVAGHTVGVREHHLVSIVQEVEAQETRIAAAAHRARSEAEAAARRDEDAAERDGRLRVALRRLDDMQHLLAEMTVDELNGRVPMRPHIAEALREQTGHKGEDADRLRLVEADAGLAQTFKELGLPDAAAERAAEGR